MYAKEVGGLLMANHFGHEKLTVYEKALDFVHVRRKLLDRVSRRVIACDHLDRGAESILLNIAEGNGRFSVADQMKFLRTAYKATVQSAALIDLSTSDSPSIASEIPEGLGMLRQIAAMLTSLSKAISKNI